MEYNQDDCLEWTADSGAGEKRVDLKTALERRCSSAGRIFAYHEGSPRFIPSHPN